MLSFMKDEESRDNGSQADTSSGGLSSNKETSQTDQTAGKTSQAAGKTSQAAGQTDQAAGKTSQAAGKTSQAAGKTSQIASLNTTLSDAGGQEQVPSQDFLVPSSSGKKVKYTTMILGVVFLVGAASLFLMIKKFGPAEAQAGLSQEELKMERDIAAMADTKAAIHNKMNDIVDRISRIS